MYESKLTDTWTRRFAERDLKFKESINNVFQEMSDRGILQSGITASRVQEAVKEELKASGEETLKVLKDVHAVHGREANERKIKQILCGLLQQQMEGVEAFKLSQLRKMLDENIASKPVLDAIDSQDHFASVQAEFDLQVDLYFYEQNQAKGKNRMERIKNSLYDYPLIAIPAIILMAIIAITTFIAALLSFRIWND